ncbi:asparagine synthase (glutamine-hydrolyzing) [Methylobacterium planeticum]|uniref:asparagine synthase (glutamine-hydrolyzing) n=1 Tax=Methylobacterium planeticum TaxID=2615211 RepID=A0A6N6MI95_9HYPH|nr:asparagine synthase (glutamine-hydrolyzing) [Methylobacterium planeticum]KAB1070758.1 asparagine synthase (glutamine-hydrolyzing) [Methylobacterium planeticum]
MCGIVGYWGRSVEKGLVERMAARIAHRGPDGSGSWTDACAGIALGHRRLAILDLSSAGDQPMLSPCGDYVVIFNGEIYNHLDIRREMEQGDRAPRWRGHSDTETFAAALGLWGIRGALERANGMFALAIWRRSTRTLTLARDRMGEKPLYYGHCGSTLFFGSELKAFGAHPDWRPEIDRESVARFLQYNYVPAPRSIYRGVAKLDPAHFVEISDPYAPLPNSVAYWDISSAARAGLAVRHEQPDDIEHRLHDLLRDSVRIRMAADVPLGAFLSGGIDSTLIAALMQAQSNSPVRTFTVGFAETAYNEAEHARAVASHLGTDHTELTVTPADALALVPQLPAIWDEPFADSSQIPTFLLSKLTREHVTVSLSGDGGDELFGGYTRYVDGLRTWQLLSRLPLPARRVLAEAISRYPKPISAVAECVLPARLQVAHLADRLPKLAHVMRVASEQEYYRNLVSHWRESDSVVLGTRQQSGGNSMDFCAQGATMIDRMMLTDMRTYLPDDILVKVDRASMAVSLEARVPFLDHRVVEESWRLPPEWKLRDNVGKRVLRSLLDRYVPRALIDRPKMGFGVPIEHWLSGPLRDWAEDLLSEERLRREGFLDPAPIRALWSEHKQGRRRWHYLLWDVLMFEAWLDSHA